MTVKVPDLLLGIGARIFRAADWVIQKIFIKIIGRPIQWVMEFFGPVVQPTRGVLIPIVLCGLALGFTDQGQELARSVALNPFQGGDSALDWSLGFALPIGAMSWWAVQSWWWARILLERRVIRLEKAGGKLPRPWLVKWMPRIYAMSVYGIAMIPLLSEGRWPDAIILGIVALFVLAVLVQRTRLFRTYLTSQPSQRIKDQGIAAFEQFTKLGLIMLSLSVLLPVTMGILLTFWRTEVTFFLGTLAVTFIAVACILPTLALLTITQAGSRAPVLLILVVYAGIVSIVNSYFEWDNHTVRASEPIAMPASSTLDKEYEAWRRHNAESDPMILVYSAGGGLRAAYWTSALLSTMEQRVPGFHCRVFAVSGVSGGSVGAVFWAGALQATGSPDGEPCKKSSALGEKVNASLAKDYLASGLSGLLFNDFLAAFVPFPPWWKDRAVALEEAWEAGFRQELGSDALANGFHGLWSSSDRVGWMPVLLLNGTHQETGQRIITSNIAISDRQFPKAYDFFEVYGREIPASTAALNSARFTYVSPAGRIVNTKDEEQGHVIDGGYFENYGARTIADLYAALPQRPTSVLLVEIINDTELKEADVDRCGRLKPETGDVWAGTINEIVAPIKGMLMARQARGVVDARMAASLIAQASCDSSDGQRFFQLRLCPGMTPSPPLGWVMGERSVENIRKLIAGEFADDTAPMDSLGKCAAELRTALDRLAAAIPK